MTTQQGRLSRYRDNRGSIIDGLQTVANRIALGLVLAALIVGAAMLMRVPTRFTIFGYSGLAMLLFIAAAGGESGWHGPFSPATSAHGIIKLPRSSFPVPVPGRCSRFLSTNRERGTGNRERLDKPVCYLLRSS